MDKVNYKQNFLYIKDILKMAKDMDKDNKNLPL